MESSPDHFYANIHALRRLRRNPICMFYADYAEIHVLRIFTQSSQLRSTLEGGYVPPLQSTA